MFWGASLFFNVFSGAFWLAMICLAVGIVVACVAGFSAPFTDGPVEVYRNKPGDWWRAIVTAILFQLLFPL